MRSFSLGFAALLLAGVVCADTFRTFTDVKGREIHAKIISFDAMKGKLEVEREDGNCVWVAPAIFSEADQAYIKKWIEADLMLSKNTLRISFKKKSESVDAKPDSESDEFDGAAVHFEVTVNNRSKQPIENLEIEYRYFITVDDKERGELQRIVPGSTVIERIDPSASITFSTKPVTFGERIRSVAVYDVSRRLSGYDEKTISDEELEGVWLKICGPDLEGEPVVRDVFYPADMEGEVAWGEPISPYMEQAMQRGHPLNYDELQAWVIKDLQLLEQTTDVGRMREISEGIEFYFEDKGYQSCAMAIGTGFYRKGLYDLAAFWMEKKNAITGGYPYLVLAELYASAPGICDGKKALEYVNQALESNVVEASAWTLSVQARVYARSGQFEKAVEYQHQALAKLSEWNKERYEAFFTRCLELYKAGAPYDLNADDPCCWQYLVRLKKKSQKESAGEQDDLWPDDSKENPYLCRMSIRIQGE
ncbi:MAG: tetratricopeptide repeat protein [Pontiellaceae bacterium]|nr:tetratricopeptide repeat protein [Pontiellaceae bacterium]MBN2783551.1 tetratricopeptide repeat protein [Pontiellaceae bacterium]